MIARLASYVWVFTLGFSLGVAVKFGVVLNWWSKRRNNGLDDWRWMP